MLGDRANIVCLYKILEKYSDEEHILSMSDITGYFMQDYGMKIDRRAVYGAADTLIELGYDISVYKENGKGYYLRSRLFEPSEVTIASCAFLRIYHSSLGTRRWFLSRMKRLSLMWFAITPVYLMFSIILRIARCVHWGFLAELL